MSMFACPACGYRDASCWRASHWMLYTVTCKIDELETCEPEIAKKLRAKSEVEIGPYWYKLVEKSGRVYRCLKELKHEYKRGHITEKPRKRDRNQRRLLEPQQP